MALFFTRQITRRLAVIKDNNARLVAEKPLNPVVPGNDEIAELDLTFHTMAVDLHKAKERDKAVQQLRDRVVAMVTHDLRKPLQTVSTYLEFIDESQSEEQTQDEEEVEFRQIAERNIQRMKRLIDDMLDLDRLEAGIMPLNKARFNMAAAVVQAKELNSGAAKQKKFRFSWMATLLSLQMSAESPR